MAALHESRSLTPLDLPQVSIARYVDLLKRRRWQVVPVSLAGLLIGALVALLIPRYYVAKSVVELHGSVLGTEAAEDPMLGLVEGVEITVPQAVGDALDELKWPEAMVEDEGERRELETQIRRRISVQDLNPKRRRQTARIAVTYKDTDGFRAMDFLNTLMEVWKRERLNELLARADGELRRLNQRIDLANKARQQADVEIALFERTYEINPRDPAHVQQGLPSRLTREREAAAAEAARLRQELDDVRLELSLAERKRDRTERTQPVPSTTELPAMAKGFAELFSQMVMAAQQRMETQSKSHPSYRLWQEQEAYATKRLEALRQALGADPDGEQPNPAYQEVVEEVERLRARADLLAEQVEREDAKLGDLDRKLQDVPALEMAYREKLDTRERAQRDLEAYDEELRQKKAERDRLLPDGGYLVREYAEVPPRPTEPNVTLVALTGSVVGLALAIGLILLVDVLQSTFKTVDDVERALALPVLGGMSYMTTDEERAAQSARRTRVGVAAAAFLALSLSLIAVYYVDATRLPAVIRDTLDLLLGAPQPEPK